MRRPRGHGGAEIPAKNLYLCRSDGAAALREGAPVLVSGFATLRERSQPLVVTGCPAYNVGLYGNVVQTVDGHVISGGNSSAAEPSAVRG